MSTSKRLNDVVPMKLQLGLYIGWAAAIIGTGVYTESALMVLAVFGGLLAIFCMIAAVALIVTDYLDNPLDRIRILSVRITPLQEDEG